MPYGVAQTIYDTTHVWQNMNDRVAFQRAFREGGPEERRMALAALTADPGTPAEEIRQLLIVHGTPPRTGYPLDGDETTVESIFAGAIPDPLGHRATDFSGTQGEITGSSRPTLEWF
jgi:hypothetical protein